jgi:hypothetical protein
MSYIIHLTDPRQIHVLERACEIIARLGIGQIDDAFDEIPKLKPVDWEDWHQDLDDIKATLRKHTEVGAGIGNNKVRDTARIAWDLYQVMRHRRSWDEAVERGYVESLDSPREWKVMTGVNYDTPFHEQRDCPLAKVDSQPSNQIP